jgi:hypothetical protein
LPPGYTWKKLFTKEQEQAIIKAYQSQTILDISFDYDCAGSTIRKVLIENGVKMRSQGRQKKDNL